nr:reverse transcriptase domain-containing protein [Tanacetum cinerariifolium]
TMTDNHTMAEMLRAPTEGCAEVIVVPPILAEQFELKHSLINMMTSEQFFGLEKDNLHDHIRAARRWLEKEPPCSITTWADLAWERYNDLLRACPNHGFNELYKLDTFYNALNPADQDSLNAAAGGNLLEKSPQDALTIIENKSKVCNSRRKPIASPVNACDINSSSEIAKLTHAVNQQTSAVTTAMTAMLKQLQANPPPAQVKTVEEICVTCRGAHPYYQCLVTGGNTFPEFRDIIQGYVLTAASNYNQGNLGYRPQGVANQMRPPGFAQPNVKNNQNRFGQPQDFNCGTNFNQKQPYQARAQSNQNFHLNELEKIKRMNDVSLKSMQNQIDMVKNKLKNEMKTSIQTSLSNQTNEIKNMMVSLLQMNTASTLGSGSLSGNTVADPKGELKDITTRSGLVTDGPTVPTPPKSVTPEEYEYVEETYTDPYLAEYTIKVPPPPVKKPKPPVQRNFVLHTMDSPLPNIHELKCKALADLGASINLMPLSVWKTLGLPDLIPTRMTLELANRAICTPDGIARDVFVPVGKFIFPADFVVVDYESDPRVPLILGRPFLRTAYALIDVHGEEMILRDGDERLTLNMKHDTASYSNHPHRESVNLINIFNVSSKDCLEELRDIDSFNDIHPYFDDNPLSGSTTYSSNSLLEEFTDELALITYPPDYDDNLTCDIESDLREIEFLLYQGEDSDLKFDVYPDNFLEIESDVDNFYDDPFDSKGEKIKESELLIDELDLPCDIIPYSEYDSFTSQDFSRDDDLSSPDNEDKDFDPPFYEPIVFKDVPNLMKLLPFSSENEEKVFKPGIYTSEKLIDLKQALRGRHTMLINFRFFFLLGYASICYVLAFVYGNPFVCLVCYVVISYPVFPDI